MHYTPYRADPLITVSGHRGMGCTDGAHASTRLRDRVKRPPENTLPSFDAALKIEGVTGLELDLVMSKDGQIVICHSADAGLHTDPFLTNPPHKPIPEMTLDQVKKLKVGPHGAGQIPTLAELFFSLSQRDLPSGFLLNLELKDVQGTNMKRARTPHGHPLFVRQVAETVGRANYPLQNLRFSSFSLQLLKEMSQRLPKAQFAFLTSVPSDEGVKTFPAMRSPEVHAMFSQSAVDEALAAVPTLTAIHAENRTITPKMMDYCKANNLSLGIWFWQERVPDVEADTQLTATLQHGLKIGQRINIMTDYASARSALARRLLNPSGL